MTGHSLQNVEESDTNYAVSFVRFNYTIFRHELMTIAKL